MQKISASATKMEGDKNFVEGTAKIVRKRKRSIGKEEVRFFFFFKLHLTSITVTIWCLNHLLNSLHYQSKIHLGAGFFCVVIELNFHL